MLLTNPLKLLLIFSESKKTEINKEILGISNSWSNTSEIKVLFLFLNITGLKKGMNKYIYIACLCKIKMYQFMTISVLQDVVITVVLTDITYSCPTHITL